MDDEKKANGTGIGLWLVKEIVNLHGEKLRMTSKNFSFEVTIHLKVAKLNY